MKKIYLLIILLLFIPNVNAKNKINSIDIDVYINESGNASITEVWDMHTDSGTEIYKPMGNMENSEITNFKVYLDNREFTFINNWNINASFNNKAYKNGFNGNELCFGISDYGNNKYTIKYDVSNIIYNANDSQFLYYKFVNDSMDPAPSNISITIRSFYKFKDTLDVWGYGYKGYAYVEDGVIKASNEDKFDTSMYSVLLVKFESGTYNTTNKYIGYDTFDDVYNKAEEDTFEYDYTIKLSLFDKITGFIFTFIPFIMYGLVFFAIFKGIQNSSFKRYKRENININNVNNFREIPCSKNIYEAFFLSEVYTLNKNKSDFLGALLLKWTKDGQIKIVKQEVKKIFKTEEVTAFDLNKDLVSDNSLECEMYDILRTASRDNILEAKEVEKWCKNNYSKYFAWFDKVLKNQESIYKSNLKINKENKKEVVSQELHNEAVNLTGLKKYLIEFSRIDKKEPIEVNLWDYYLIYAQIFGIAKEVAKQFEELYPEVYETSEFNSLTYSDFVLINNITSRSYSVASSARSAAQSYSSGGGGFSSGGGGGGSFGGGSGGGVR